MSKWSWWILSGAIAVLMFAVVAQPPPARVGAQAYNAVTTAVVYAPTVNLTPVTTPQILANPRRIWLRCTNDSANVIYLSLGTVPVLSSGIRLNINSGNDFQVSNELGNLWQGSVSAVTGTTASVLLCIEGSQ